MSIPCNKNIIININFWQCKQIIKLIFSENDKLASNRAKNYINGKLASITLF